MLLTGQYIPANLHEQCKQQATEVCSVQGVADGENTDDNKEIIQLLQCLHHAFAEGIAFAGVPLLRCPQMLQKTL
jgi:hypothetical protein